MGRNASATLFYGVTISKRDGDLFNRALALVTPECDQGDYFYEIMEAVVRLPTYASVEFVDLGEWTDHYGLSITGFVHDCIEETVKLGATLDAPDDGQQQDLRALLAVLFPGGFAEPEWRMNSEYS